MYFIPRTVQLIFGGLNINNKQCSTFTFMYLESLHSCCHIKQLGISSAGLQHIPPLVIKSLKRQLVSRHVISLLFFIIRNSFLGKIFAYFLFISIFPWQRAVGTCHVENATRHANFFSHLKPQASQLKNSLSLLLS